MGNAPAGREGGEKPKPWNLIPAAVAWYAGAYPLAGEVDSARRTTLQTKTSRLVKKFLIEPCTAGLPATKLSRPIRWRDFEAVSPQIERLREEVTEGRAFLSTNL